MTLAPDPATPATIDLPKAAIVVTLVLLAFHLVAAARLELMYDEAYYVLWARHHAWGYHDHPPGVAAWIQVSTTLFGTSDFGVRALGVVATAMGSLAVYAIGMDLWADRQKSALAALIWNACPLIGVGAILITPDTPFLFGWTTALWGLGRLYRTQDWRWWLVVGAGAGIALESKYTALFLGPSLVLAMLVVPRLKPWWRHPGPYLGGALAFAMFLPNIVWNARHGWETFHKQFGRVGETEWTLRFLGEFLGSQIGLLGPLTFVLVAAGLILAVRGTALSADGGAESQNVRRLLASIAAPLLLFFAWHSLHDRVQGNWVAPLYPVLALLAADAAMTPFTAPPFLKVVRASRLLAIARTWCVPTGLALTALIYAQAWFAPLPLPAQTDPTALLTGWRQLSRDLDALATREKAGYVLTQGYALTSLLKVYNPSPRQVLQFSERKRWSHASASDAAPDPSQPGLYIVEQKRAGNSAPLDRFAQHEEIARLQRTSRGRVLETYAVFRVSRPLRAILDDPADEKR